MSVDYAVRVIRNTMIDTRTTIEINIEKLNHVTKMYHELNYQ